VAERRLGVVQRAVPQIRDRLVRVDVLPNLGRRRRALRWRLCARAA
jgi:hypothetical protein